MKKVVAVGLLLSLSACSWLTDDEGVFRDRKKDYRKSQATPRMEIPADLDSVAIVDYHIIPEISPYADPSMLDELPLPPEKVTDRRGLVKIQRMGEQGWIVVNAMPSRLWPQLKQFLDDKQLQLTQENGTNGVLEAVNATGTYRFKLEQGFQRRSSELYVRYLKPGHKTTGFWPAASDDNALEQDMLQQVAQSLADAKGEAVYSYAAQNISTTPKLRIVLLENGLKAMVLLVSKDRALASLKDAFASAGFDGDVQGDSGRYLVKYLPPLPEDKKPGFWKRLFGIKAKPYDDDVEYSGNSYQVLLTPAKDGYQVIFALPEGAEPQSERQKNKQLNQMLDVLKGHLG